MRASSGATPEHRSMKRSSRTDEKRINKHGEHLHQTLLDRMTDIGGSRGIGGRAHTRLIGKEAPLNAVHHGRAGKAAEDGPEIKGAGKMLPSTLGTIRQLSTTITMAAST